MRALIEGGADINNVGGGEKASPLLIGHLNGQFDSAMLLIEKGANPNIAAASNGVTPLWAAVNVQWQPRTRFPQPQEMELQKATYLDVVKALLKGGADANGRIKSHPWIMVYTGCGNRNCGLADTSGSTAFWRAAYSTDVDAMKLLVGVRRRSEHPDAWRHASRFAAAAAVLREPLAPSRRCLARVVRSRRRPMRIR